jgi:hypothetical protein
VYRNGAGICPSSLLKADRRAPSAYPVSVSPIRSDPRRSSGVLPDVEESLKEGFALRKPLQDRRLGAPPLLDPPRAHGANDSVDEKERKTPAEPGRHASTTEEFLQTGPRTTPGQEFAAAPKTHESPSGEAGPSEDKTPVPGRERRAAVLVDPGLPVFGRKRRKFADGVESAPVEDVTHRPLAPDFEAIGSASGDSLLEKVETGAGKEAPSVTDEPEPEDPTPLGRRKNAKLADLEDVAAHDRGVDPGVLAGETLFVLGESIEASTRETRGLGPALDQGGEHTAAEEVAFVRGIGVARILQPFETARASVGLDLRPRPIEQRSIEVAPAERTHRSRAPHPDETRRSRRTKEGEGEALETVVGVMGEEKHALGIETGRKPCVTGGPPTRFGASLPGGARGVEAPDLAQNPQASA